MSSTAKLFDYTQVDGALEGLGKNIEAINTALADQIVVKSYEGSAQADVERAIDSIRVNLQAIQQPLTEMKNKINEIREEYAKREAQISSSLSGIGNGGGTGKDNNTNTTM